MPPHAKTGQRIAAIVTWEEFSPRPIRNNRAEVRNVTDCVRISFILPPKFLAAGTAAPPFTLCRFERTPWDRFRYEAHSSSSRTV